MHFPVQGSLVLRSSKNLWGALLKLRAAFFDVIGTVCVEFQEPAAGKEPAVVGSSGEEPVKKVPKMPTQSSF